VTDEHAEVPGIEGDEGLPNLIVVAGPTASGKTGLGIDLALQFNGEVVNADSRYLYRGLDIGVGKPDMAERRGVPHHLIDICAPSDDMSLATYQDLAMRAIEQVHARGKLPILVGGTPLYVNAVVEGWRIPRVAPHPEIRTRLEEEAEHSGLLALAERLAQVDPIAAERSSQNLRRVIRALEIFEVTGRPMSELEGKGPRPFRALELGLTMPRERLYEIVDRRVDHFIKSGLIEEVRMLLEGGVDPTAPAMSSIGYRQLLAYLAGETTLDESIQQIKADTRRYVKHQETWLRRNKRLMAIEVWHPDWRAVTASLVGRFLERAQ
jgi:tRNA dimethylallyltransferase